MKSLVTGLLFLLAAATSPLAASFSFPSDAPVATVDIPDSWGPSETDYGVEGTSADGGTYVSLDVAGESDMEAIMSDVFTFLEQNGVVPDPASQKETKDTLNGMPFETIDWSGTDTEGPVSIGVGILGLSPEHIVIVTYWASTGSEAANMPEVGKILASIKPAP